MAFILIVNSFTAALSTAATEGFVKSSAGHKLWYRIANPKSLDAAAPLVVCHGGPQVPSDYLFDLEQLEKRAVIFYDQLGCGRSESPPADSGAYGVEQSVADLRAVLSEVGLSDAGSHHLYGQSWGGLLAFSHLTTDDACMPLSLTLSNTPSDVSLVEAEAGRLIEACGGEVSDFMALHNLRDAPADGHPRINAAYAHAGSTWRGSSAIAGLAAGKDAMKGVTCPTLVMRGEHDFCTAACVEGWSGLPDVKFETLYGASHHALLEKPEEYLRTLDSFLRLRE